MRPWSNLTLINKQCRNPLVRLFCFPHAGGSASAFSDWSNYLPFGVELIAIQLPGREAKINEPLFTNLYELIDVLTNDMSKYLNLPFVFFGHSMGALISFELARNLRRNKLPKPLCLFVSGFRAPHLKESDPPLHDLPNDVLIEELRKLGGTADEIFEYPELVDLLLPAIRQDIALCENYSYEKEKALNCPILAIGGLNDKRVRHEELEAWKEQTSSTFELNMLPGDHFFLQDQKDFLLDTISLKLIQINKGLFYE